MLDVGVCPAVRNVVLQGGVWRLQDVSEDGGLVWVGWVARACGVAGALLGGEGIAQVVKLLFCSGKSCVVDLSAGIGLCLRRVLVSGIGVAG